MRNLHSFRWILPAIYLTACAPLEIFPTPTPTITLIPTATATITPSSTPTLTPTPTRTSTPTPFPTPTAATFKFDEGISPTQQETIQQGIALAQAYLGEVGPLTVYAYASLDKLTEEYARRNRVFVNDPAALRFRQRFVNGEAIAITAVDVIYVYLSNSFQRALVSSRLSTMAHEYFHARQHYLSSRTTSEGPPWLIEGGAEFASYRAVASYGFIDWDRLKKQEMERTRGLVSTLRSLETDTTANDEDNSAKYTLGYLATDLLASLSGEDAVLNKYWSALRISPGWRAAFQSTFGMSIEQFSARFEEYRHDKFPPYCGTVGDPLPPGESKTGNISLDRQHAPGAFAIISDSSYIPYTFCVNGFRLGAVPASQLSSMFTPPTRNSSMNSCGGNCVILAISPAMPPGPYVLAMRLPSGEITEVKFEYTVPKGTVTPTY